MTLSWKKQQISIKMGCAVGSGIIGLLLVFFTLTALRGPVPSRVSSGINGLEPSTSNIHLALIFNHQVTNPATEKGFDYLWGGDPHKKISGIYNAYYDLFDRSGFDDTYQYPVHNLAWFQTYQPTWVVYQCDGKTPAWETDDPRHQFVPIDITNLAVLNYKMSQFIVPHLEDPANSYSGVAFDGVNLDNQQVNTGKGEIRCGTLDSQGVFHNRWGGSLGLVIYRQDVLNWAMNIRNMIRQQFPSATMAVNFSYDFNDRADSNALLNTVDIDLDGRGFTNGGNKPAYLSGKNWITYINAMNSFQSDSGHNDKGYVTIALEPGRGISSSEVQWALASYMMVQERYSYIYITDISNPRYYGSVPTWLRTLVQNNPTGSPTGPPVPAANNVYSRTFTNALALVNPSSTQSYTFTLTHTYKDIYGSIYSGMITLAKHTGLVLLPV